MEKLNEITYKRGISKNSLKLRFKQLSDYYDIKLRNELRSLCTYAEGENTYTTGRYFILSLDVDKIYVKFEDTIIPAEKVKIHVQSLVEMINYITRKINAIIEFIETGDKTLDVVGLLTRYDAYGYAGPME